MKNISKALMLLSAGTLLVLGSCDMTNPGESTPLDPGTSGSLVDSGETKTASRIKHSEIPYMEEGVALDLDKYVTIEYSDGSTDKNYEISCSKSSLKILEGTHKIKSDYSDSYVVVIKAGALTTKLSLDVLSNEQIKLIAFLAPLEENPRNFTIDLSAEDSTGKMKYYWSYYHNEKYTGVWDKDNPTKLVEDPESEEYGEPNSTILAELSDGSAYWGAVGKDGQGNPKAVFEPGPVKNWDWYYFTMDLVLDAADSKWVSYEGDDVLMMSPEFCANLLNYGCSQLPDNYGYEYYGAVVVDYIADNAGNPDKYIFDCLVSDGRNVETWARVTLYDIGETNPAFMTQAVTDASYVPAKITANEITTAFDAINTAGNYTMTLKAWSRSGASSMDPHTPAEAQVIDDACANIFGTTDMVLTQKVTADGIYSELKDKKLTSSAAGYTPAADYTLTDVSAVFNAGGQAYSAKYDGTEGSATEGTIPAASAIAGQTDVFQIPEVKQLTAGAVTSTAVDGTTWTRKTTDDANHLVGFSGDVGDNDGATVRENALFQQLLDMFSSQNYGTLEALGQRSMGTSWTQAEDFNQGDKHALTLYSSYDSFVVNTATNEVTIMFDMYAPVGLGNGYFGMSLTIDHIGTTTHDFSSLIAGVQTPGLLA